MLHLVVIGIGASLVARGYVSDLLEVRRQREGALRTLEALDFAQRMAVRDARRLGAQAREQIRNSL